MKKGPNPKLFLFLTALALVVGIGLSLFEYSKLQGTEAEVAKLHKDALNQSELESNLKSSLTQLQQCSASLNHLEKGVPQLDYVPTMLKELENIGTESGLQVLGVRPAQPGATGPAAKADKQKKANKGYTELDIEVTCLGPYEAVKRFVEALQSFPKVVAARTITLNPKMDGGKRTSGPPVLEATIALRSYLFPPDKSDMTQTTPNGGVANEEAANVG